MGGESAGCDAWKRCKGKGSKGKGKGKDKGKSKCFDGVDACGSVQAEHPHEKDAGAQRPCEAGCGFAATWHATHCCGACAKGKVRHGPRCEQRALPCASTTMVPAEGEPS